MAEASEAVFGEQSARPGRRPGRPRDTNSDDTRWRILEAALDAFADRGYDGVSTREIARQAEVTSATVYHHFPSKFSLYQDAYRHAIDVAFGAYATGGGRAGLGRGRDRRRARLLAAADARTGGHHLARHPRPDRRRASRDAGAGLHESARAFIDGMIDRAVARGELAAGDAVLFERMLLVLLWGLAMTGLNGGAERVECVQAIKRMLTGTLLRG